MKYHFKIRKEGKGYWAECVELNGCHTQASTKNKLQKNMKEVLNLYLSEPPSSKAVFSLPNPSGNKGFVEVQVIPRVALAFMLRRTRLLSGLTQKQAADRLGLSGLYSYQRLENPKTANPEFETIVRLKEVFPELNIDELLVA